MSEPKKPHIFLFTGSDSFTIAEKLAFWKKEFQKKYGVGNLLAIDCETGLAPEDALHQLQTAFRMNTLFSSAKIVIIKNIFSKTALAGIVREFFEKNIDTIPQSDFLVFTSEKPDKKSGFATRIARTEKSGIARSETFDTPRGAQLRTWMHARIQRNKASISQYALEYLAQKYDTQGGYKRKDEKPPYDLWRITHDTETLSAYATGRSITKEDIDLFIPRPDDAHIFDLTDALALGNVQHALHLAHGLIPESQSQIKAGCIHITALLIGQFRGLFLVKKLLDAKKSEQDIADILDWDPKRVWVNRKKISGRTADELQHILRSLCEYDFSLKTTSHNPLACLDLLICRAGKK
jgi:DNA polymerase III delta subunit